MLRKRSTSVTPDKTMNRVPKRKYLDHVMVNVIENADHAVLNERIEKAGQLIARHLGNQTEPAVTR